MKAFNYDLDYRHLDLRAHPELYSIGKGEQGVLLVRPYKDELLPLWRFKNTKIAQQSAKALYSKYCDYKANNDFVGMDVARKYLQMGYTRSRRYANHSSGRKYSDKDKLATHHKPLQNIIFRDEKNNQHWLKTKTKQIRPQDKNALTNEKARSANIFYAYYRKILNDADYQEMKQKHRKRYEL